MLHNQALQGFASLGEAALKLALLCVQACKARGLLSSSSASSDICAGFNKYYPPDYDGTKHGSLNTYRGKHALGDRARKIDQGILIVRFELPFNIWCGTCNNHIGMGVRYNAEKKKIGNYYSTPIYSFRCKCHLCDGWFEIETDPKNTRYIVTSGARQKDEEWDPEENGGFAVHDTDPNAGPVDPLAALEKSTAAETYMTQVQVPRLEALQSLADHYSTDPYSLSRKVRKRFREEKKIEKAQEEQDKQLKSAYGLPEELPLSAESEETRADAKQKWREEREALWMREAKRRRIEAVPISGLAAITRRKEGSARNGTDAVSSLRAKILENTRRTSTAGDSSRLKPPDVRGSIFRR
ncbi:uncharacterized protein FIBRA_09377 [Fibroporia radiculosa]|uniref:DUF572-domain-containing protein n=1 Tax=Fibroporia radiculosa TaxID=599839 RepID=J7RVW0_9APHY|nr:uncharacterized protein FIBRA_09377 [Fibroporia radiculosa]CCM07055.1 predicted protein [Fibroporia radiculosa]